MRYRWISCLALSLCAVSAAAQTAHFHHVHLNVVDPDASVSYYEKYFGAVKVMYRGKVPALFTERSFILLETVAERAPSSIGSTLWHIGWAGVDGAGEFEWRKAAGIEVHTPVTPLGDEHYMYFYGPDRELVEVYTGSSNHRFEHNHLVASDIDVTMNWFKTHLGLRVIGPWEFFGTRQIIAFADNVNFIVLQALDQDDPPEWLPTIERPQKGTVIDHIAFSYRDLDSVHARLRKTVPGTTDISADSAHGFRRFFIPGPDGLNVEIVEEKPIPGGLWD